MESRIEFLPLSGLLEWPGNPKGHRVDQLRKAIERFGMINPIIVDDASRRIVAGHGRLRALNDMKEEAPDKPPSGVRAEKEEWLVPVLVGHSFASEAEAEAYLVADNKLVEMGGWLPQDLAPMLDRINQQTLGGLLGTGFTVGDQDALRAVIAPVVAPEERPVIAEGGRISKGSPIASLRFGKTILPMTPEDAAKLELKIAAYVRECGSLQGFAGRLIANV